jgi:hypothetical protein
MAEEVAIEIGKDIIEKDGQVVVDAVMDVIGGEDIKSVVDKALPVLQEDIKEIVVTNIAPIVNEKCSAICCGWVWSVRIARHVQTKPEETASTSSELAVPSTDEVI